MSAPAWVRIGGECVCIEDDWECPPMCDAIPEFAPKKNDRLTVAYFNDEFLMFNELPASHRNSDGDLGYVLWPAECFRPLAKRTEEQDLAIFRPILDQVPEVEPA